MLPDPLRYRFQQHSSDYLWFVFVYSLIHFFNISGSQFLIGICNCVKSPIKATNIIPFFLLYLATAKVQHAMFEARFICVLSNSLINTCIYRNFFHCPFYRTSSLCPWGRLLLMRLFLFFFGNSNTKNWLNVCFVLQHFSVLFVWWMILRVKTFFLL